MHIGFAYDLKEDYLALGLGSEACAEFDSAETIEAIEAFLRSRGHTVERIGHMLSLTRMLAQGKRWDCVFNIAEGLYGRGREAQVPALLDAYQIPYVFSDALVLALTLDKALTKRVIRDAGIPTADFMLLTPSDTHHGLAFPVFVKPNAEGTGKGVSSKSLVHDSAALTRAVEDIFYRFQQPALAESYLSGREFTVGITGTGKQAQIIGVMEIHLLADADACGYTYANKQEYETRVHYSLPEDSEAQHAAEVALAAWNVLGCRDGGRVDIRSDADGIPHFLEVNPLAGLHPVLGDLVILSRMKNISYHDLLGKILHSALSDEHRFPPIASSHYA